MPCKALITFFLLKTSKPQSVRKAYLQTGIATQFRSSLLFMLPHPQNSLTFDGTIHLIERVLSFEALVDAFYIPSFGSDDISNYNHHY